jgi:hypothetical protein
MCFEKHTERGQNHQSVEKKQKNAGLDIGFRNPLRLRRGLHICSLLLEWNYRWLPSSAVSEKQESPARSGAFSCANAG